jgi:hypothetical protein
MRQYNFLGHGDFGGSVGKGKQTNFLLGLTNKFNYVHVVLYEGCQHCSINGDRPA